MYGFHGLTSGAVFVAQWFYTHTIVHFTDLSSVFSKRGVRSGDGGMQYRLNIANNSMHAMSRFPRTYAHPPEHACDTHLLFLLESRYTIDSFPSLVYHFKGIEYTLTLFITHVWILIVRIGS